MRPAPDVPALVRGVLDSDRASLARALTLVESAAPRHRASAESLVEALVQALALRPGRGALRLGITGVPGVGKSTFIDAFGTNLTSAGHRVAVLAVDPSSRRTGGSILGDKTRMAKLAADPRAFVRPQPTSGALGGVTSRTREALLVLEAAGYDVVIVETVGVGQSEIEVAEVADFTLVLMLAGAGDELQGIKRGLLEVADLVAVNKADGDNRPRAERAARTYRGALHLLQPVGAVWAPPVQTCSAVTGDGLEEIWTSVLAFREKVEASGHWERRRSRQRVEWLTVLLREGLEARLRAHPEVASRIDSMRIGVREGTLSAPVAARQLLDRLRID